jgi:hypothetical protein
VHQLHALDVEARAESPNREKRVSIPYVHMR